MHHRADYISSRKAAWFDVLDPCEELQQVIHERKTDEEQAVLGRVSALSTAVEASDFVDEFTLPEDSVDPGELSKVIKFIDNGGEQ
ncbi:hypothetical protein [Haloarcula litorea]|uniref:hypothetical protein n=1 Tax=Haloarcula litorea TaxID=3032579 RepID=UPI0023E8B65F|nr:hypothetical protein [Halomicroarcula sp. GDY20]